MATNNIQSLLRFLSQDAKIPLATAISKAKDLQTAALDTPEKLAKTKPETLRSIFQDEKQCKQIISAAKRAVKKRSHDDDDDAGATTTKKQRKDGVRLFSEGPVRLEQLEESLSLPISDLAEEDLGKVVLFTNRAPLVLAFLVTLLKYTMPEQPLSSRLSLAQGYVSLTSRARAVYLGIEGGGSAEEEGFGEGQPSVVVAGKEVKVLRRWGYEWKRGGDGDDEGEEKPALWALDLEAMKKSGKEKQPVATNAGDYGDLPICTPQSARAYLLKSFDTAAADGVVPPKKLNAAAKTAEKERNLGKLLQALDTLYDSWARTLSPKEMDGRTWNWYTKVRPAVADGAAGWGGKNQLKLADILALRSPG